MIIISVIKFFLNNQNLCELCDITEIFLPQYYFLLITYKLSEYVSIGKPQEVNLSSSLAFLINLSMPRSINTIQDYYLFKDFNCGKISRPFKKWLSFTCIWERVRNTGQAGGIIPIIHRRVDRYRLLYNTPITTIFRILYYTFKRETMECFAVSACELTMWRQTRETWYLYNLTYMFILYYIVLMDEKKPHWTRSPSNKL